MKWPNFLKKKELLFSPKTSREELVFWGDRFLDAVRLHDALAFYRQAGHREGMARIREAAIERGDFFLFREALNGFDPRGGEVEELRRLASKAEAAGRWQDARKAYELLKDQEGARKAEEALEALMGDQNRPEVK